MQWRCSVGNTYIVIVYYNALDWLVPSNRCFSHLVNSLFPAFSSSHLQKNFCTFLSPWSVYRLLPGRTWFHCEFNKDSAAPLVTALDLVTGLEWGRRPCSGRPRHRNPSADGKASENRGPGRVVYTPGAGPKIARKWKHTLPWVNWDQITCTAPSCPLNYKLSRSRNFPKLRISHNLPTDFLCFKKVLDF